LSFLASVLICNILVDLKLSNPLSEVLIFTFESSLLVLHGLCDLQLAVTAPWWTGSLLLEFLPLIIVKLHVDESELFLESGYLPLRDVLIEGLLGYKLAAKVLNLKSELPLDGSVLFPHNVTPD
jgi:hypothetical protein